MDYSVFKLCSGFAIAAFIAWKLNVTRAIIIESEVQFVLMVPSTSLHIWSDALGPLYVIQASRLSGNLVFTSGSPYTDVVPSKRVKVVLPVRRNKKFGLTAVEVLARVA